MSQSACLVLRSSVPSPSARNRVRTDGMTASQSMASVPKRSNTSTPSLELLKSHLRGATKSCANWTMLQGSRNRLFVLEKQLQRCLYRPLHSTSPACIVCSCEHRSSLQQGRGNFHARGLETLINLPMPASTRRKFSDRLLGYSPMSPPTPAPTARSDDGSSSRIKNIPTAEDVTVSGGVWAPTSAKRDKLGELKTALEEDQETLDDAAKSDELLDLFLADGIQLIAKTTDKSTGLFSFSENLDNQAGTIPRQIVEFEGWLDELQKKQKSKDLTEAEMNIYLEKVVDRLASLMAKLPAARCLRDVRDFYDASQIDEGEVEKMNPKSLTTQDSAFDNSVTRFRLQLAQSAAGHLKESWKALTTVSDADIDRAAVQGITIEREATTVPLEKINAVLKTFLAGSCSDRVDATWELIDRDGDGLLDEAEMNHVAFLSITPVQTALVNLFKDAIEARPVRAPFPIEVDTDTQEPSTPMPQGWRQRRREARTSKRLFKMFQNTCKNHFDDECEINHRLRCIYAWAEKSHQHNKIDSIMVDSGWSGRKRYVELNPKISLPEFREVQREHFTHLDRVGTELLKSFREDLWVLQGRGRENRELMRDCMLYLGTVCAVDYAILML